MKGVILAAGQGSRLGLLTRSRPKALVPVLEKPLIEYILTLCDEASLEEIIVVGGYQFYKLAAVLEKRAGGTPLGGTPYRLLQNREYKKGNLLTLVCALPFLEGDFFIANADHIYPPSLFHSFLKNAKEISAACDFDRQLSGDDMKIRHDSQKRLLAISKKLPTYDGGYIGMTSCTKKRRGLYERAVEATFQRKGTKAVVEEVLETLILWGENPLVHDASGHRWWEVDTPSEIQTVERELALFRAR
ncbi:MAG: NTP transferase domain-containing protein [Deltaproteobacteria bacterium]|nr:NTP transferase domain-containing protein [Deltaproteobacteria bacterium]